MRIVKAFLVGLFIVIGTVHADDREVVTSVKYVTDELSGRQDKIPAQTTGTHAVTYTNAAGGIAPREVKSSLGNNASDPSLPTVSGVNTGLESKQNEIPAKNTNTVLTYTGNEGTVGEKGIYQDTGTYAAQSEDLIDAGTFNAALKNGLDNEFVCAGHVVDDDPTTPCWLWEIHSTSSNSPNLFDVSKISNNSQIVNNGDGTITVTTGPTSSAVNTRKTILELVPRLEVGKTYTLSFKTTGSDKFIVLHSSASSSEVWEVNHTKTMTQDMLDSIVYFYASGVTTTATISEIQIVEGSTATPYVPYGNVYIPQNQ